MTDYLAQVLVYTGATAAMVPLFNRLGFGSVLGYLVAGMILGPSGLALVSDPNLVLHVAEFGVVLMLFLIGLELQPTRLWALRRLVLGLGGLQVAGAMFSIFILALLVGAEFRTAFVICMAFALSSTALVLQMMDESKLRRTSCGQSVFSVLLFQDIIILPMLALVPFLGNSVQTPGHESASGLAILFSLLLLVIMGKFLIRPVLRTLSIHGGREAFTAGALFLITATSLWMHSLGVSMALGTFVTGVLLADSEFRHELEITIQPFKALLLGLFFISVGMSMDMALLWKIPVPVFGCVLAVVLIKLLYQVRLARRFGMMSGDALLFGLMLSQCGEFGFVLLGLAHSTGILEAELLRQLNLCIALSMVTTPLLFRLRQYWHHRYPGGALLRVGLQEDVPHGHKIIICGFGRFGQVIGRFLHGCGAHPVVLDNDAGQVETLGKNGYPVYLGDPVRSDVLHAAGAADAEVLIVTLDDEDDVRTIVEIVRKKWPHLKVYARARSRQNAMELKRLGVRAIRETFESSLELGRQALVGSGVSPYRAHRAASIFRRYDQGFLSLQAEQNRVDGKSARLAREEREMLADLLREDALLHAVIEGDADTD